MTIETPISAPRMPESATTSAAGPAPQRTPRKRGPNKPKPVKSGKIRVKTVFQHRMWCHPQNTMIPAATIVEVERDEWIGKQIKLGRLIEV